MISCDSSPLPPKRYNLITEDLLTETMLKKGELLCKEILKELKKLSVFSKVDMLVRFDQGWLFDQLMYLTRACNDFNLQLFI